jgi:AcrR family transcriptional regulator
MDQIAAEAGVTKPVVYRFFRDKGDLYEAIATRYVEAVATELRAAWGGAGEPRELLRSGIDTYLRLVEEEPEIYRFLMRRARVEQAAATTAIDDFIRRLGGELGLLVGEQLASAGLDTGGAEAWGHAIVGLVAGAADWWVDRRTMSRQRLVGYLADLLWSGFDGAPSVGTRA